MQNPDPSYLLSLISEAYPGLISYIDDKYKFKFASHQYAEWFEVDQSSIIGKHIQEIIGSEHYRERKPYIDQALQGKKVHFTSVFLHKSLGQRDIEIIYHPDIGSDGKVRGLIILATDISDRKRAECAATEHEERLKNFMGQERQRLYFLFMQAPISISILTGPDHIFELINTQARSLIGGRDVTGLTLAEALPELVTQGYKEILDEIYYSGKGRFFHETQVCFNRADGSLRQGYADVYCEPWKDESGRTIGIINLTVDVTDKVFAHKQAEEKEELFRTYAESMPQMAFIADAKGELTYLNQRWFDYTGLNFDDSKNWHKHPIHDDEFEKTLDTWSKCIRTGTPYQLEHRLRGKDGTYRWYLSRAVPLKNSQGRISQWVGTKTDIDDQKKVSFRQAHLLQMLESSSDFIGMADTRGRGIYLNNAAREILGLTPDQELTKTNLMDCFLDEDKSFARNVIFATTIREGSWVGEIRLKHFITGEVKWFHYYSFTTHDEKTGELTGFATVSRDLTEIKAKELKLEDALRARDEFLSIASHELKTPLTSLKLQSQLTLRTLDKGLDKNIHPDKQKTMAKQTNDLVSRLSRLIDDMLDVSRIRTGKLLLDKEEHNLEEIAEHVVSRMSLLFEISGLQTPMIRSSQTIRGFWDRFRLEQVIGNLLTNAIRYGQGKPIEIEIIQKDEKAQLIVRDHGYGIGSNDLKRIFERFERAIHPSEVSGMGLGLYISQEIVQSHQGSIWVESEVGQGSTFIVELPIMSQDCAEISSY